MDSEDTTEPVGRLRSLLRRRWVRRGLLVTAVVLPVAVLSMVGAWLWIRVSAGTIYTAATVPAAPVAIVLGAGLNADGTPKPYLTARLQDAETLYETGKVQAILVSGDNGSVEYDEVSAMRTWLLQHGIPQEKVVADYAGFDTYDSCVRAKRIFGVGKAIVVTQDFHVRRAVFLCRNAGIDTTGVASPVPDNDFRYQVREIPAALKAVVDTVFQPDPRFLGPQEPGIPAALASGR
jgi:vancomycin permeability regulator SanA